MRYYRQEAERYTRQMGRTNLVEPLICGKVRAVVIGTTSCNLCEERKPTKCNNIDGLLSIMDVGY